MDFEISPSKSLKNSLSLVMWKEAPLSKYQIDPNVLESMHVIKENIEHTVEISKLSTGISVSKRCQTVWRDRQCKLMRRRKQQKQIV
jgi:hypothetical protein